MAPRPRRIAARLGQAVVAVAALGVLTGCAGDPPASPPAGVDGLIIPTPAPDPDDFAAGIDNPWLPLEPGATWVYEASGDTTGTVTVTVTDRTREVAGVTTTVVEVTRTEVAGDVPTEAIERWYAEDRAGNVWYFGTDGADPWEAGVDGAEAGLAMAATPRVGDGYEIAAAPGVAQERGLVLAPHPELQNDVGRFEDLVVVEVSSPLEPGLVERRYYARGTGLVHVVPIEGAGTRLDLTSYDAG